MYRMIATCILLCGIMGGANSAIASTSVPWELKVNNKFISTAIHAPYQNDDGIVMVPLRITSEELGYTVHWDAKQKQIKIDAPYQVIFLKENTTIMHVDNDFKVINLSGDFAMDSKVVKKQGVLYVPATFYERLLVGKQSVNIAVSMAYTTDTMGQNSSSQSLDERSTLMTDQ
ncbi:copper amine oxidase N-terminal domain-containing protein [Paenibacillus wenxiniae]|uniref:Copper amine oxidase N-terminal domain-containing protein n=1 Tax=Paenibacillus wenxiniae TaxID=1636843 RepID=A0ABW4RDQ5_9BACL